MTSSGGVLYVHSAPSALCPHVEWAVGAVVGVPVNLGWVPQPVERASYRAELEFTAPAGTAAALASKLKRLDRIRFEVTQDGAEGVRYSYTPTLGIFHALTARNGDIVIPEDRIKKAFVVEALGGKSLHDGINELLGTAWDDELEAFRHAGDGAPVRWLHQVV